MLNQGLVYGLGALAVAAIAWLLVSSIRGLIKKQKNSSDLKPTTAEIKHTVFKLEKSGIKSEFYGYLCPNPKCNYFCAIAKCPDCGANLTINSATEIVVCKSCHFKASLIKCGLCHEVVWQN